MSKLDRTDILAQLKAYADAKRDAAADENEQQAVVETSETMDHMLLTLAFPAQLQPIVGAALNGGIENILTTIVSVEERTQLINQIVDEIERPGVFGPQQQAYLWQKIITPAYVMLGDEPLEVEAEPEAEFENQEELITALLAELGYKRGRSMRDCRAILDAGFSVILPQVDYPTRKKFLDKVRAMFATLSSKPERSNREQAYLSYLTDFIPAAEQVKLLSSEG